MELKLDKTTKILLGAIALGLFLNASDVFIDKAYANDCASWGDLKEQLFDESGRSTNFLRDEILRTQHNIIECIRFDATCIVHLKNLQQ